MPKSINHLILLLLLVIRFKSVVALQKTTIGNAVAHEITSATVIRELQMYSSTGFQTLMINAVNKQRTANGLSKLCMNKKLQTAAQGHSDDMAKKNYLSHMGSDGSTGQTTVDAVMTAWMVSSGHRANILNVKYTMFGCGYAYKSGTTYKHYWIQDFANGATESCS